MYRSRLCHQVKYQKILGFFIVRLVVCIGSQRRWGNNGIRNSGTEGIVVWKEVARSLQVVVVNVVREFRKNNNTQDVLYFEIAEAEGSPNKHA